MLVNDHRFAGADNVRFKTSFAEWAGVNGEPFAVFVNIRDVYEVCLRVINADVHIRLMEDLADLVADCIVNALNI